LQDTRPGNSDLEEGKEHKKSHAEFMMRQRESQISYEIMNECKETLLLNYTPYIAEL
jgi:hypothetical protein